MIKEMVNEWIGGVEAFPFIPVIAGATATLAGVLWGRETARRKYGKKYKQLIQQLQTQQPGTPILLYSPREAGTPRLLYSPREEGIDIKPIIYGGLAITGGILLLLFIKNLTKKGGEK
ncbi:MAG: hypothetical protein ABIM98_07330 [candidate division WOR-3 bacterium]